MRLWQHELVVKLKECRVWKGRGSSDRWNIWIEETSMGDQIREWFAFVILIDSGAFFSSEWTLEEVKSWVMSVFNDDKSTTLQRDLWEWK